MEPADDQVLMELLINIDVQNLPQAIRFYTHGLGLRFRRMLFDDTVAELDGAASPVLLLEKAAGTAIGPGAGEARSYRRHWTPVHLDFVVAELDAAIQLAVSAGAKLEADPEAFRWGRQALMSDPFGNGFCLLEWRNGGDDAVAGCA